MGLALSVLLSLAIGVPVTAAADDVWTDPYPGIRHLYRTTTMPRREINMLVIDLEAPGIAFTVNRHEHRNITTPDFARQHGVDTAINAGLCGEGGDVCRTIQIGRYEQWPDSVDNDTYGNLAFGLDRLEMIPAERIVTAEPWMAGLVSSKPTLVHEGVERGDFPPEWDICAAGVRHPRTAVGLSEDRRTLYLVVIDGRTGPVGMTCRELATFMRELGAHYALNLDGGGSSTMWIRGTGTVNAPSDGAPRTVANHLGVNAGGAGMPGSCVALESEEAIFMAGILDESSTSDLDGDGRADVCARAGAGIRCHLATGTAFGEPISGPSWSDESGWGDEDNWSTIRMGDLNGDGLADICGRSNSDYRCLPSTGTGFGTAFVLADLANANGWDRASQFGTIRLADFDGDGDDDVCGRDADGFHCWPSTGTAFGARVSLAELSDANGWDRIDRWGSIRMGDIDGDGRADVCARGSAGLDCWRSLGDAFATTAIAGPRWADMGGWTAHRHWSTIRLADIDGDFQADVCGRSGSDFRCHLSTGDGFGPAITGPALSDENGWSELDNYSTIRLADIDGDGDRDVCGRANDGMRCWPWQGSAFGAAIMGPDLSDEGSWDYANYHRSIRVGDVNGDGRADICGRGYSRLYCWLSDGTGFPTRIEGPGWSNAGNWWKAQYHGTIRIAGPPVMRPVVPPPADAGPPPGDEDAGVSVAEDAGEIPADVDAGRAPPRRDAGPLTETMRPSTMEGGCGCHVPGTRTTGTPTGALAAGALAGLLLLTTRLRARGSRGWRGGRLRGARPDRSGSRV